MTGLPAPKPTRPASNVVISRHSPVEAVVRVVAAQLLDEDVDVVVARGGRAPREVRARGRARRRARSRGTSRRARRCRRRGRRPRTAPAGRSSRPAGPPRRTGCPVAERSRPDQHRVAGRLLRRPAPRPSCSAADVSRLSASMIALPSRCLALWACWLNLPSIETEVSGSFCSRRSFQTCSPLRSPSRSCSADSSCARRASSPPPLPNTAAISAAHRDHVVAVPRPAGVAGQRAVVVDARRGSCRCRRRSAARAGPARTRSTCVARKSSVCCDGLKGWKLCASWNGFSPGTSSAATRPGPRSVSISSPRSSAVTKPIPYITSSRVGASMCGTLKLSRVTTRSGRAGKVCTRLHAQAAEPEHVLLEVVRQVGGRDVVLSGVSPS